MVFCFTSIVAATEGPGDKEDLFSTPILFAPRQWGTALLANFMCGPSLRGPSGIVLRFLVFHSLLELH